MEFNTKQRVNLQSTNTDTEAERKFHEISVNILTCPKNFSLKEREDLISES